MKWQDLRFFHLIHLLTFLSIKEFDFKILRVGLWKYCSFWLNYSRLQQNFKDSAVLSILQHAFLMYILIIRKNRPKSPEGKYNYYETGFANLLLCVLLLYTWVMYLCVFMYPVLVFFSFLCHYSWDSSFL